MFCNIGINNYPPARDNLHIYDETIKSSIHKEPYPLHQIYYSNYSSLLTRGLGKAHMRILHVEVFWYFCDENVVIIDIHDEFASLEYLFLSNRVQGFRSIGFDYRLTIQRDLQ